MEAKNNLLFIIQDYKPTLKVLVTEFTESE